LLIVPPYPIAWLAQLIDGILGDPDWLWRRLPHPVCWIGDLISNLDRSLNKPSHSFARRRLTGVLALLILLAITAASTVPLSWALRSLPFGWVIEALLAAILIAQRSLYDHVLAVAQALQADGLAGGRRAVSAIVGRDPETLDEAGIGRAALESLAENFSDGVVAPVFWLLIGGLPGIALYKAINTADSMIGHRTERYNAFGWAAARLDDAVNLPASRLTALLLLLASFSHRRCSFRQAWRALWRDAKHHRSPNAGWPESVMAGALGLRLAGPRRYGGALVEDRWMGDGRAEVGLDDIHLGLSLYVRACLFLHLFLAAIALSF